MSGIAATCDPEPGQRYELSEMLQPTQSGVWTVTFQLLRCKFFGCSFEFCPPFAVSLSLKPFMILYFTEPCQDDSSVTDLTVELAEMMPKVTAVLERLMNSEGMMEMFMSAMSKFNGFVGN